MFEFLSSEVINLVNFIAALFTIAAAIIALITLLTWRKQQLLGPKLSTILEAEDHYYLVMQGYIQNFNFFYHSTRLAFETREQSRTVREEANDVIVRESQKINFEKIALNDSNFQLSILRLQRLGLIDETDLSVDVKHLSSIFESYLELIKNHDYSDKVSNQELIRMFSQEIHWIGERGKQTFKVVRDSL